MILSFRWADAVSSEAGWRWGQPHVVCDIQDVRGPQAGAHRAHAQCAGTSGGFLVLGVKQLAELPGRGRMPRAGSEGD